MVRCTSLSPPEPPSRREEPMESISSMKMMDGACSRAITKSSRTIRAPARQPEKTVIGKENLAQRFKRRARSSPSPMNFCTSSEPDTRMKVQSVW